MYTPPTIYAKLSTLLQEELDLVDKNNLRKQLASLEAFSYELALTRAEWFAKLYTERERLRMPKSSEYTELDRKTMMDASTAIIEKDYEFLTTLQGIVSERIHLGSIFLT